MFRQLTTVITALFVLLGISGCGFSLRGADNLPADIQVIELNSTGHNKALQRTLEKRLKPYGLTLLQDHLQQHADLQLTILPDELDRRLLSLFGTGQVAEYELVYTVNYLLQFADHEAESLSFSLSREYQDDPDTVLAKSRELDIILDEMRQLAAERIIRQIASSYANLKQSNNP